MMAGCREPVLPELPDPRVAACQDQISLGPWRLVPFLSLQRD